ncbi:MAG: hypothetical protein ACW99V_07515 [Candidatus Thorarchaeota archaeon]
MLELAILVIALVFCAGCTYSGSMRASGRVKITEPSDDSSVGMGGARGRDYSYASGRTQNFPVGLRGEGRGRFRSRFGKPKKDEQDEW